jgi:capsular polysaccharide export protein
MRPWWSTYERAGANGLAADGDDASPGCARRWPCPRPMRPRPPTAGATCASTWSGARSTTARCFSGRGPPCPRTATSPVAQEFRLHLRRLRPCPSTRPSATSPRAGSCAAGCPSTSRCSSWNTTRPSGDWSPFLDDRLHRGRDRRLRRGRAAASPARLQGPPARGRARTARPAIRAPPATQGIADRVHFIRGGKLARLMDRARAPSR